jgi:hypothetical protein
MSESESGPVIHTASDMGKLLGIEPRQDPDTGLWFYLWDNMFDQDETGKPKPTFGAQETARVFFGKGADWLRWRYRPSDSGNYPDGYFVLNGVVLEPKRTPAGQRYYTLADIERMAHALASNEAIDGERVATIVAITLWVARLYEIV